MNDSNDGNPFGFIDHIVDLALDIDVMGPVEEMLKAAEKKALSEATDTTTTVNSVSSSSTEGPTDAEKARIKEELAALRKRFEEVLEPRPVDFDVIIDTMKKAENALGVYAATENLGEKSDRIGGNADFGLVDTAKTEVAKWEGEFRNQLVDNYLTPLSPGIIATQGNLARYLRQHAELMKMVYTRRRSDAKKIAEDAVAAFEAINDSQGSDLKIVLSVIGGLIGFGTAVAGPFASTITAQLAIGLSSASFGAANAIGGNFHPAAEGEVPLGADTVDGVADNIYKALDDNDKKMQEEEEEILKSLQNVAGVVAPMIGGDSVEKGSELIPLRPKIADASTPEELQDGLTIYDRGHGGDGDGDGGRGSWFGPGAPEDWDGSVHNPPTNLKTV